MSQKLSWVKRTPATHPGLPDPNDGSDKDLTASVNQAVIETQRSKAGAKRGPYNSITGEIRAKTGLKTGTQMQLESSPKN
ncbi:UNVERIFIED_CONTAM: hypothetical protein FKN15_040364 [Acipenser sinensis]